MPEPIKTETIPTPIVSVSVVGTGESANPIPQGTVAVTPDHLPNVVVNIVQPMVAIKSE